MLTGKLLEESSVAFPTNPQIPLDFTDNFQLHKHNSLSSLELLPEPQKAWLSYNC